MICIDQGSDVLFGYILKNSSGAFVCYYPEEFRASAFAHAERMGFEVCRAVAVGFFKYVNSPAEKP